MGNKYLLDIIISSISGDNGLHGATTSSPILVHRYIQQYRPLACFLAHPLGGVVTAVRYMYHHGLLRDDRS